MERAYIIHILSRSTQVCTSLLFSCSPVLMMTLQKRTATSAYAGVPKKVCHFIKIDEKLKMIKNHEGGMRLMAIAGEFGWPVLTVATIMKDKDHIRKAACRKSNLQMTITTKKHEGQISNMEKLLARWIKDCIIIDLPLSFRQIHKRMISLYEAMKRDFCVEEG